MGSGQSKTESQTPVGIENNNEQRKADHIRINLEEDVSFRKLTNGFDDFFFMHEALPEIDFNDIDTSTFLFDKKLRSPLLISSMTGGTAEARQINRILAEGAQEAGIAMGLGSMRAAIEDDSLAYTYEVRDLAPDIPLFANLGAVQLNYGYGLDECRQVVDMIEADALILHFNALQEAVQPEGDGNFANLLPKIENICKHLGVPIIAKEVGWGFSERAARQLADTGVAAIDVAGAGGTSWSQVEMYRAPTARHARVAGAFVDWGIPTAVSIRYCRQAAPSLPLIASGGIRDGIDVAKSIALGATIVGFAGAFLKAADNGGVAGVIDMAETVTEELRVTMFASSAADHSALSNTTLHSHF